MSFHVGFGDGARLGHDTSLAFAVSVSPKLTPVTELRLLTSAGIDLTSSGLGAASCRRPADEIAAVMNPVAQNPCPANSLMGTGSAQAALLVEPAIDGAASLELHAGASVDDKPGLVVIANTYNPARFHLTYQGYLYIPPPGFGIGVAIRIPQIPQLPFGAPIALSHLQLVLGGPGISYTKRSHGRVMRYHPSGVPLPRRCPKAGFRFRLILRFADGGRSAVDDVVRCPALAPSAAHRH
ncbi:hypothetical protein [Baekduia alba]|uniref:hypothetical protein n=1 Tax=Baekduia alba TaxID=2997333 RepID=UPI00234168EE|nr:hypothetical protein [Baekduia alba]